MPPHTTDAVPETAPERRDAWRRGAFMLFFLVAFGLAQSLQAPIAVVQFVTRLTTHRPNPHLADFGRSLAMWLAETCGFLTCATENKPFPFARWPRFD